MATPNAKAFFVNIPEQISKPSTMPEITAMSVLSISLSGLVRHAGYKANSSEQNET